MRNMCLGVALLLLSATCLSGCGTAEAEKLSSADLQAVLQQMTDEIPLENAMEISADRLQTLYGIARDDIKQSACCVTMNGVFPDEIIMLEAADEEAAGRIRESLEAKLASFLTQAVNYDPAGYQTAQECAVLTRGNYVALFLSSSHRAMEEIYTSSFS